MLAVAGVYDILPVLPRDLLHSLSPLLLVFDHVTFSMRLTLAIYLKLPPSLSGCLIQGSCSIVMMIMGVGSSRSQSTLSLQQVATLIPSMSHQLTLCP